MELDKDGVDHEFTFWKGFVKSDRFTKDWCSSNKTNELHQVVYDFLQEVKPKKVLDVGSGPVSLLHGSVKNITTVDPLSSLYQQIVDFDALGIKPPYALAAEELKDSWEDKFDVVHCSNALDHTLDPMLSSIKLFNCVKPGGHMIVQGFENEAIYENWAGFHQWDLSLNLPNQDLEVRGKNGVLNIIRVFPNKVIHANTYVITGGRGPRNWFIWITQKNENNN